IGAHVADRDELTARHFGEIADDVRAPVPVADYTNSNHRRLLWLSEVKSSPATPAGTPGRSRTAPITRARTPATIAEGGTARVPTAPAPISAPSPIVTPGRMVAWLPIDAPRATRVGTSSQSASVCSCPSAANARGTRSLVNITPCPTKTPSSIATPSQMNVWL